MAQIIWAHLQFETRKDAIGQREKTR